MIQRSVLLCSIADSRQWFGSHARTPLFLLSCSSLPKLRLCPVHPCINPIKSHQFLMGSLFSYFPMIQQDDHIRIPDCGKTVGNDDRSPVLADFQQGSPVLLLGDRIHGTGGLIQNQDRRIGKDRFGNGQQLPLPLGQLHAPCVRIVSYPSGRRSIKPSAPTILTASRTCSMEASGCP